MQLADMGAEVVKIENRRLKRRRQPLGGPVLLGDHDSDLFQAFNRNKRSISAEPASAQGQQVAAIGGDRECGVLGQSARRPAASSSA